MRKIARFIRSSLMACAILSCTFPVYAQPVSADKLDPLAQGRLSNLFGRSRVIVRGANASSLFLVTTLIRQLGGVPGRQLPILNAVVADVPNVALPILAGNSLVVRVALDRAVRGSNERTG